MTLIIILLILLLVFGGGSYGYYRSPYYSTVGPYGFAGIFMIILLVLLILYLVGSLPHYW